MLDEFVSIQLLLKAPVYIQCTLYMYLKRYMNLSLNNKKSRRNRNLQCDKLIQTFFHRIRRNYKLAMLVQNAKGGGSSCNKNSHFGLVCILTNGCDGGINDNNPGLCSSSVDCCDFCSSSCRNKKNMGRVSLYNVRKLPLQNL